MFRDAFRHHRCIIPASLWKPPPTRKQPYRDGSVLPFADLWDEWHDPESGQQVKSCTIRQVLTWPIHDRMLVLSEQFQAVIGGHGGDRGA